MGRVNEIAYPKDSARHRNSAGIDLIHSEIVAQATRHV